MKDVVDVETINPQNKHPKCSTNYETYDKKLFVQTIVKKFSYITFTLGSKTTCKS